MAWVQDHDGARLRAGVGAGGERPRPRPVDEMIQLMFLFSFENTKRLHERIRLNPKGDLLVRSRRQRSLKVVEADVQPPKTYIEREASS